jgi:hypothetical protein
MTAATTTAASAGIFTGPDPTDCTPRRQSYQPEHRLLVAVLEQAAWDLRGGKASAASTQRLERRFNRLQQKVRDGAERWTDGVNPDWPFAFRAVCECLGLDPDATRTAMKTGLPALAESSGLWTPGHDARLAMILAAGCEFVTIARRLGRTVSAIEMKKVRARMEEVC